VAVRLRQAWARTKPWLTWGGRVTFGLSSLVTVAIIYTAVLLIATTTSRSQEGEDGGRLTFLSQNNFAMWFGQDMFFWLMPRPYSYYSYYGGGIYGELVEEPPKMSFFEAIFSFVFGDGNPNTRLLSETRWQLIGERIAENGGAVVAEQVVPFLDPPAGPMGGGSSEQRKLDEAMLPVLLRFKGRPEVSPEGHIVYVFPELQESRAAGELILADVSTQELKRRVEAAGFRSTAADREGLVEEYRQVAERLRARGQAPQFLNEQEMVFSEADESQVASAAAYGAVALLATLWLGTQIASGKALFLARVYPIVGFVVKFYPWLLAYSAAYLGIPLIRWLRMKRANQRIEERNAWRAEQAARAAQPGQGLLAKVRGAARWALGRRSFGDAVYDSSQSAASAKARSEADEMADFDARLGG